MLLFQRNFSFAENFVFHQPFKETGEIYRPSERQNVIRLPAFSSLDAEKSREAVDTCPLFRDCRYAGSNNSDKRNRVGREIEPDAGRIVIYLDRKGGWRDF